VRRFLIQAAILCIPITLNAQSTDLSNAVSRTSQSSAQQDVSLSGTVSSDAKSFVSDKDGSVWLVSNPERIKNMAGHRAALKCFVRSHPLSLQVISAKPAKTETRYAVNLGDAVFRR
jgi:hypothetical protein